MGKGSKSGMDRLLTTSASTGHLSSPADLPDLDEADVWSVNQPDNDDRPMFITSHRHTGGLSLAFDSTPPINPTRHRREPIGAASSAPVSMPDWTGLVRQIRAGHGHGGDKCTSQRRRGCYIVEAAESESKEDDGDDQWVPPHVWAQARGGSTSSVFEGVGRTLKGRDMSRVRDAVWNQTGFFG